MKNVKCILIDAKNKEVKEVKFDGKYFSIHDLLGKEVEAIDWSETLSLYGDLIYYELISECESEHFVSVGDTVYRGNVVIVGKPTDDSDEYNPICTNVKIPLCIVKDEVEFHNMEDVVINE